MTKNRRLIIFLILLDLVWVISAIIYDWNKILSIPIYFWPFIIICPVFPLLLGFFWLGVIKGSKNHLLLAFAAIPSVVYFVAAIIYYPTWMIFNGFDILTFGQIFWVAVYGLQGMYILKNYKIKLSATISVIIFLLLSFLIQYLTKTFGLFDTTNFPPQLVGLEYLALSVFTISIFLGQMKKVD